MYIAIIVRVSYSRMGGCVGVTIISHNPIASVNDKRMSFFASMDGFPLFPFSPNFFFSFLFDIYIHIYIFLN